MTDASSDHSRRLEALEMHFAHQDRLIAELNDVVTAQWQTIAVMERKLARLREELQTVGTQQRDGPEPPPPHY